MDKLKEKKVTETGKEVVNDTIMNYDITFNMKPKSLIFHLIKNSWNLESIERLDENNILMELFNEYEDSYIDTIDTWSSRWWDNNVNIYFIEGHYFKVGWANSTGDDNIFDMGFCFDWNSVIEVESYVEMVKVTRWREKK